MNRIASIILLFIAFIITSCSTNLRNTPFIDTDETLKLKYNMSKDDVLKQVGYPLYVEMGDKNSQTITWVYEVRTIKVLSNKDPLDQTIIPNKTHRDQRPDQTIHKLKLEFVDDKLQSWGPIIEDTNTTTQKEDSDVRNIALKQKSSRSLFIHPRITLIPKSDTFFHTWTEEVYYEGWDYGYWYTDERFEVIEANFIIPSIGLDIGYGNASSRWGLDLRLLNTAGLMLKYEKLNIFGFNISAALGVDFFTYEPNHDSSNDNSEISDYEGFGFGKIGIFKDLNFSGFPLSAGLEIMALVDNSDDYYDDDGSSVAPSLAFSIKYRYK